MIWTLQKYVGRELAKNFALWLVAMTALFSLGASAVSLLRAEGLGGQQLITMMGLIVPLVVTMVLPIAALFGATLAYGRLSADREFDACRAGGVNIHLLLAPVAVLSLLVTAATFGLFNFALPRLVKHYDQILRRELHEVVAGELDAVGFMKFQNYRIYADRVVRSQESEGVQLVQIDRAGFMEVEHGAPVRYGTARRAVIRFDNRGVHPEVTADLQEVRAFDRRRRQYYQLARQPIGPYAIDRGMPEKPKWLNLVQLLYFQDHPERLADSRQAMDALRGEVRRAMFMSSLYDQIAPVGRPATGRATIQSAYTPTDRTDPVSLTVSGRESRWEEYSGEIKFRGGVEVVEMTAAGPSRRWLADRVDILSFWSLGHAGEPVVMVRLLFSDNVRRYDLLGLRPDQPAKLVRDEYVFPAALPASVRDAPRLTTDELLADGVRRPIDSRLQLTRKLADAQQSMARRVNDAVLKIRGIIHFRLGLSASSLVLIVIGATLGIVLRAGQMLVAVGVGFVPTLVTVVTIMMGRPLVENAATTDIGVIMIWASIGVMGVLDVVLLTKVLRR